jgi:DNA repair protein RecO (recombination protein O)
MNKQLRTKAIVLKRTNYGEADRIVQILTPEGKFGVMARGVRKEKSKLAGGIELLAVSDVVINEGRGELGTLTSARLEFFYKNILTDYDRLQFANQALKSISAAAENVRESIWFEFLKEILKNLNETTIPLEIIQSWFYLRYASYEGHELSLDLDVDGNKLNPESNYRYDYENRGLILNINGPVNAKHIKILRVLSFRPIATIMQVGGIEPYLNQVLQTSRDHAAVSLK